MYYYSTRDTKDGDRLMTSYASAASQKKYGAGGSFFNGLKGAEIDPEGKLFTNETGEGLIVRSFMQCVNPQETSEGKFEILIKVNGSWKSSGFRFAQYGAANTLMKVLAPLYQAVMVIEPNTGQTAQVDEDDLPKAAMDDCPF